jgi:hypothetical protein
MPLAIANVVPQREQTDKEKRYAAQIKMFDKGADEWRDKLPSASNDRERDAWQGQVELNERLRDEAQANLEKVGSMADRVFKNRQMPENANAVPAPSPVADDSGGRAGVEDATAPGTSPGGVGRPGSGVAPAQIPSNLGPTGGARPDSGAGARFQFPSGADFGASAAGGRGAPDDDNGELTKVLKDLIEEVKKMRETMEKQNQATPQQQGSGQAKNQNPATPGARAAGKSQGQQPKAVMQGAMAVARMLAKL